MESRVIFGGFVKNLKISEMSEVTTIDYDKPLWQLTVGEFLELTKTSNPAIVDDTYIQPEIRKMEYGIAGIARIFNCSMTTANRIKQSGKIDKAISQSGRKIVIDVDLALSLFKNDN